MPVRNIALPKLVCLLFSCTKRRCSTERAASEARRLLFIAKRFGVAIPYLEKLLISLRNGGLHSFPLDCFERLTFSFKRINQTDFDYSEAFKIPISSFKKDLLLNSSEYCLTELGWNLIFLIAFRHGLSLQPRVADFRIVSQWDSSNLRSNANSRFVDWAVVMDSLNPSSRQEIPIFMIEAGVELVPSTLFHKDFKKLCCLMTAACFELAYDLISVRKKPELARIYGLLVSGTEARLLIAHPVLTLINDVWQMHVNISGEDSWAIHLLNEGPLPEVDSHELASGRVVFETVSPPTSQFPRFRRNSVRTVSTSSSGNAQKLEQSIHYTASISVNAFHKCVFVAEMVKATANLIQFNLALLWPVKSANSCKSLLL